MRDRVDEMEASNSFLALSVMGSAFETKGMKSKSHGFSLLASLSALFWASVLASSPLPIHVSSSAFVIKSDLSHLAWCARFMPQWKKCFGVSIVTQNSCCRSVWHSLLSAAPLQLDFQFHICEEWKISMVFCCLWWAHQRTAERTDSHLYKIRLFGI